MAHDALPETIGRYEIVREIGRGAMGIVYEGRDASLGRSVAIKTMSLAHAITDEEREQFERRFDREARAAAALQHPGIVVVYEVGTDFATQRPYMVLEFLRGQTLHERLAEGGRLEWKPALRLVARLAEALHHAHSHGIFHRDMKPANVMILPSGDPKVMDFGVARLETSKLTTQGQVFGTPSYMAPEQATEARTDARSDVFSLGCILYECLAGRKAFPGRNVSEIVLRLTLQEPEPLGRVVPGLPAGVERLVARALVKDPARRCPTARALADDITALLEAPAIAPTPAVGGTQIAGRAGAGLALPAGKRVSLAFLSGPRSGEVYVLERPMLLIGRAGGAAGAGLEIADPQVSRAHALLECHAGRFVLRDMDSSNGTFVDGQRIREHDLEDHAEFQVGASRVVLIVTEAG